MCDISEKIGNVKKGICYIVGSGENYGLNFIPASNDYVIAADAGFRFLEQSNIKIDMAIGDFDTLNFIPNHPNVITLNTEKDETDMLSAVHEGIKKGYDIFHLYCGTGGRIDHTIANIQILAELSQTGKQGFLFGKNYIITALTNGTIGFTDKSSGYVSVFAHSNSAEGIYLNGLKYELQDAVLTNTYSLGVSNEFTGRKSSICVKKGTLIIVFPSGVLPIC